MSTLILTGLLLMASGQAEAGETLDIPPPPEGWAVVPESELDEDEVAAWIASDGEMRMRVVTDSLYSLPTYSGESYEKNSMRMLQLAEDLGSLPKGTTVKTSSVADAFWLTAYTTRLQVAIQQSHKQFQLLRKRETTLGSLPAQELLCRFKSNKLNRPVILHSFVIMPETPTIHRIELVAPTKQFDDAETTFLAMARRVSTTSDRQGVASFEAPTSVALEESSKCSKWSIRRLRLGMTLSEAKQAHPDLGRDEEYDSRGYGSARFLLTSKAPYMDNDTVDFTDSTEDAPVVSIVVCIDTTDLTLRDIREALIEKWGPPELHSGLENVFFLDGWSDRSCDVRITVTGNAMDENGNKYEVPEVMVIVRSIRAGDTKTASEEHDEKQRARKAVE